MSSAIVFAVLLAGAPSPASPSPTSGLSDDPHWLLTAAVRSHPGGGAFGAEALFDLGDTTALGAFLSYAYYWAEMGSKLEWRAFRGLIIGGVWIGVEPGDFIPASSMTGERKPGLRGLVRGRLELNVKLEHIWLYDRLTLEGRVRTFEERDPYRDADLGTELSVEEAIAPLFKVAEWGGSALWLYAELTVAAEASFGLLDLRPSGGLIVEDLFQGMTLDLDLYRSLRDGPIQGFGALLYVWWRL